MNWVRIACDIEDDPSVRSMARALGIDLTAAVGCMVRVLTRMPKHARDGYIGHLDPLVLEDWTDWRGEPGAFARQFLERFTTGGHVTSWMKHNGAAIKDADRRAEAARERRRAGRGQAPEPTPEPDHHGHDTDHEHGHDTAHGTGDVTGYAHGDAPRGVSGAIRTNVTGRDVTGRDVTEQLTEEEEAPAASARVLEMRPATTAVGDTLERQAAPAVGAIPYAPQLAELRAAALEHERAALDALLASHAAPWMVVLELYSYATGLKVCRGASNGRTAGVADVMAALAEMVANGDTWNVRHFRGYLRSYVDRPAEPPTAEERQEKRAAALATPHPAAIAETPRTAEEKEALRVQREKAMAQFRQQFHQNTQPDARLVHA